MSNSDVDFVDLGDGTTWVIYISGDQALDNPLSANQAATVDAPVATWLQSYF